MAKYIVSNPNVSEGYTTVNLRLAPDTTSYVLEAVANGTEVEIVEQRRGWSRVDLLAGGAKLRASGWLMSGLLKPATTAPPPTPAQSAEMLLGVHGLYFDTWQGIKGQGALTLMNQHINAYNQAKTGRFVMQRRYFNQALSPETWAQQQDIPLSQANHESRVKYLGNNENDIKPYDSSPQGIKLRSEFDAAALAIVLRQTPNAGYVGGGWAHGNPDFTNPDVCEAMRLYYAPIYNKYGGRGFFVNLHNYTKGAIGQVDPIWFERRWQFLFERCGFDARVRAIVSDETGVEAGAGGFQWAGYGHDRFGDWCRKYLAIQRAPMVINGIAYESPMVASTIFQYGDTSTASGHWGGYDITGQKPVIEQFWAKQALGSGGESPHIFSDVQWRGDHQWANPRAKVYAGL